MGVRCPQLLLKYVQVFAVCFSVYAPAYFLFLYKVELAMPGSDGVSVFGQAGNGGFIILGLLCLDPKPGRFWLPMAMGAMVFLAAQVRAEWVGIYLTLGLVAGPTLDCGFDTYHPNGVIHGKSADALVIQ